jgi:hypothetical protein
LGSDQAIVKPLVVGHLCRAGWMLLMLDAVPVRVGDQRGWWGTRDWRRVGGRNAGGFIIRRKQGVIIAVMISIDEGNMPSIGTSRVAPTLKHGGAWT